jgi:hypothetical protein
MLHGSLVFLMWLWGSEFILEISRFRLTAGFKLDGPIPQGLSSTYGRILNHLLDHA